MFLQHGQLDKIDIGSHLQHFDVAHSALEVLSSFSTCGFTSVRYVTLFCLYVNVLRVIYTSLHINQ